MNRSNAGAERVLELFKQARARAGGEERDQFLMTACDDDADLRARVDEMLGALEDAHDFLQPGDGVSAELEAEFARLKPEEAPDDVIVWLAYKEANALLTSGS